MQSLRLLASDLQKVDIAQLNPEAIGNIKKLSVSPGFVSTWRSLPFALAFVGLCRALPSSYFTVPCQHCSIFYLSSILKRNSPPTAQSAVLGCGRELGVQAWLLEAHPCVHQEGDKP